MDPFNLPEPVFVNVTTPATLSALEAALEHGRQVALTLSDDQEAVFEYKNHHQYYSGMTVEGWVIWPDGREGLARLSDDQDGVLMLRHRSPDVPE